MINDAASLLLLLVPCPNGHTALLAAETILDAVDYFVPLRFCMPCYTFRLPVSRLSGDERTARVEHVVTISATVNGNGTKRPLRIAATA